MGKGVGHLAHVWSYGVREVVSSNPDRGNIVGWVFHPTRWLARFSLIWICLSFQILNLFRTLSSWGSINYRPSAPLLYEVASHVKKLPFRPILLLLLIRSPAITTSLMIRQRCNLFLNLNAIPPTHKYDQNVVTIIKTWFWTYSCNAKTKLKFTILIVPAQLLTDQIIYHTATCNRLRRNVLISHFPLKYGFSAR